MHTIKLTLFFSSLCVRLSNRKINDPFFISHTLFHFHNDDDDDDDSHRKRVVMPSHKIYGCSWITNAFLLPLYSRSFLPRSVTADRVRHDILRRQSNLCNECMMKSGVIYLLNLIAFVHFLDLSLLFAFKNLHFLLSLSRYPNNESWHLKRVLRWHP